MTSGTSHRERLAALLRPVVALAGYDLDDVVVTPVGRRRLVRVVVDGKGGLSLDQVAEVSRAVSAALDANDQLVGSSPYVLEVSSPGVDRPLTQPRHWRRAVGRLVKVTVPGRGQVVGRLRSADDAAVVLDVNGAILTVAHGSLGKGHVQVEFNHEAADEFEEQHAADGFEEQQVEGGFEEQQVDGAFEVGAFEDDEFEEVEFEEVDARAGGAGSGRRDTASGVGEAS